MDYPVSPHRFCKDADCRTCLKALDDLRKYLEITTGIDHCDHLGRYRQHLDNEHPNIKWETEDGWHHPLVFDKKYIDEYVNSYLPTPVV